MTHLNHSPGTLYRESGKIDYLRLLIFCVIGYLAMGVIGVGYGLLTNINPIIYLNIIILVVGVIVVYGFMMLLKSSGKLRNRYVALVLGFFFGFVFIYNAWSAIYSTFDQSTFGGLWFQQSLSDLINNITARNLSIGKIGRDGTGLGPQLTSIIYAVEALAFIVAPAYLAVKDPSYYCEDCDKAMVEQEYFFAIPVEKRAEIKSELSKGKLDAIFQCVAYEEKQMSLKEKFIRLKSNTCPSCNEIVFSAAEGKPKMDKSSTEFKKTNQLCTNVYGSRSVVKEQIPTEAGIL